MNWKLPLWAVLATGAAGVGGYYAYKGRDCISGQAAVCEKERAELKARSGQIEVTLNQTQGSLSTSRQELEALRKWKGDAAKRMQTFRDMSTKLQKMVDAGKLGVHHLLQLRRHVFEGLHAFGGVALPLAQRLELLA